MNKLFLTLPALVLSSAVLAACNNPMGTSSASPSPQAMVADDTSMMADDAMMSPGASPTAGGGTMVGGAMMTPNRDLVANAMDASNLTTLVTAVQTAGLVDTLKGAGPYTVFAPTNEAFDALPDGTVDTLMEPASKTTLTKILTYHVVPGKLMSADLRNGQKLKTVQGQELTVAIANGEVTIRDAKGGVANIETADVQSSNGVAHVIDAVLMPN